MLLIWWFFGVCIQKLKCRHIIGTMGNQGFFYPWETEKDFTYNFTTVSLYDVHYFLTSVNRLMRIPKPLKTLPAPFHVGMYVTFLKYFGKLDIPKSDAKFRWKKLTTYHLLRGQCCKLFPKH